MAGYRRRSEWCSFGQGEAQSRDRGSRTGWNAEETPSEVRPERLAEMLNCPHCRTPVDLRKIKHQGMLVSYRVCPACNQAFEVDPKTKRRQAAFIVLALVSLVLTVLMRGDVQKWLPYALPSYLLLSAVIYYGNKRVFLVKSLRRSHDAAPTARPDSAHRKETRL